MCSDFASTVARGPARTLIERAEFRQRETGTVNRNPRARHGKFARGCSAPLAAPVRNERAMCFPLEFVVDRFRRLRSMHASWTKDQAQAWAASAFRTRCQIERDV